MQPQWDVKGYVKDVMKILSDHVGHYVKWHGEPWRLSMIDVTRRKIKLVRSEPYLEEQWVDIFDDVTGHALPSMEMLPRGHFRELKGEKKKVVERIREEYVKEHVKRLKRGEPGGENPIPSIPRVGEICICGHPTGDHIPFTFECLKCQCKQFKSVGSQRNPGNPGNLEGVLKKEGEYFKMHGGLTEFDMSINQIQRDKIAAYWKLHPNAHVGLVNRHDRTKNFMQKYNGEKVYNFQWEFIIPQHDTELLKLLLAREQAPYTGTKEDIERLKPIWARIEQLGGLYLVWA
jgi:hypothetical protein